LEYRPLPLRDIHLRGHTSGDTPRDGHTPRGHTSGDTPRGTHLGGHTSGDTPRGTDTHLGGHTSGNTPGTALPSGDINNSNSNSNRDLRQNSAVNPPMAYVSVCVDSSLPPPRRTPRRAPPLTSAAPPAGLASLRPASFPRLRCPALPPAPSLVCQVKGFGFGFGAKGFVFGSAFLTTVLEESRSSLSCSPFSECFVG
jgi:hypothetical protein